MFGSATVATNVSKERTRKHMNTTYHRQVRVVAGISFGGGVLGDLACNILRRQHQRHNLPRLNTVWMLLACACSPRVGHPATQQIAQATTPRPNTTHHHTTGQRSITHHKLHYSTTPHHTPRHATPKHWAGMAKPYCGPAPAPVRHAPRSLKGNAASTNHRVTATSTLSWAIGDSITDNYILYILHIYRERFSYTQFHRLLYM